eukprot:400848-Amphidinium_carterae.1
MKAGCWHGVVLQELATKLNLQRQWIISSLLRQALTKPETVVQKTDRISERDSNMLAHWGMVVGSPAGHLKQHSEFARHAV